MAKPKILTEIENIENKVDKNSIINDLTIGGIDKVASAETVKMLNNNKADKPIIIGGSNNIKLIGEITNYTTYNGFNLEAMLHNMYLKQGSQLSNAFLTVGKYNNSFSIEGKMQILNDYVNITNANRSIIRITDTGKIYSVNNIYSESTSWSVIKKTNNVIIYDNPAVVSSIEGNVIWDSELNKTNLATNIDLEEITDNLKNFVSLGYKQVLNQTELDNFLDNINLANYTNYTISLDLGFGNNSIITAAGGAGGGLVLIIGQRTSNNYDYQEASGYAVLGKKVRRYKSAGVWTPWVVVGDVIEIGTWTPTIRGNTGVGNNSYLAQIGNYEKNGKTVTLSFRVALSEKDFAMTGVALIGGLPFLPKDKGVGNYNYGQIVLRNITLNSDERFSITARSNILEIVVQINTNVSNLNVNRLNNNTEIAGSITYEI